MIEWLKKEYDRQWSLNIRPPVIKLTKRQLKEYFREARKLFKTNYSGSWNFRDAKLEEDG